MVAGCYDYAYNAMIVGSPLVPFDPHPVVGCCIVFTLLCCLGPYNSINVKQVADTLNVIF